MPLEPPSVLLQGFGPFCLGTLFARFGLWIATDMATEALSTPRSSLGAQGVRGCSGVQPNPCQAPPEHMKPPYRLGARWQLGCFSFLYRPAPFGHGWDLALLASANHRRVTRL